MMTLGVVCRVRCKTCGKDLESIARYRKASDVVEIEVEPCACVQEKPRTYTFETEADAIKAVDDIIRRALLVRVNYRKVDGEYRVFQGVRLHSWGMGVDGPLVCLLEPTDDGGNQVRTMRLSGVRSIILDDGTRYVFNS